MFKSCLDRALSYVLYLLVSPEQVRQLDYMTWEGLLQLNYCVHFSQSITIHLEDSKFFHCYSESKVSLLQAEKHV